jgi:hypothetical protein
VFSTCYYHAALMAASYDHLTFDAKRKRMIGAPLATIWSKWSMHLQVATYAASQASRRKPYQL